jgi:hypothetical protein
MVDTIFTESDPASQQTRTSKLKSQFNLILVYKSGRQHIVPDALSRLEAKMNPIGLQTQALDEIDSFFS